MAAQLQVKQKVHWVAAELRGTVDVKKVAWRYQQLTELCERFGKKKLLIDITKTRLPLSTLDKFEIGDNTIIFALHQIKVAVVANAEQIDPERFGELVAVNRGANLHIFNDVPSAEEWLMEE